MTDGNFPFKKIGILLEELAALSLRGLALTVFYFACAVLFIYYILFVLGDVPFHGMVAILAVFALTRLYERRRDRRFKEVDAELTKLLKQEGLRDYLSKWGNK